MTTVPYMSGHLFSIVHYGFYCYGIPINDVGELCKNQITDKCIAHNL